MRDFIQLLKDRGELLTVSSSLNPRYEISTILSELGKADGPAILVERVKGHSFSVIGNLLGTRERLSMALGVDPDLLCAQVSPKLENKLRPVLISDSDPREMLTKKQIDILKVIPVLTHYSKDSGPYITSGITSATDPLDGTIGRGLHRMEVRGKNLLGISLMNPPLSDIYARCKKENRRMEVATAIGVHPAILVACVFRVPAGTDKLCIAGGLMGQPVPVVATKTVDLNVPAHAEITIEGYINPRDKEKDGVLGESSGYYLALPNSPAIHVTAISCRKGACFHAIMPWGSEVDQLGSFIHLLDFLPKVKKEISCLRNAYFIPKTFGSHVVMSLDSENKGEIRRALTLALSFPAVKKAIAVGTDIDPANIYEVEWAMATRFQADKDMIVLPSVRGSSIDPSVREGFMTTKVGIDATGSKKEGFEKVDVPEAVKRRLAPLLKDLAQPTPPLSTFVWPAGRCPRPL